MNSNQIFAIVLRSEGKKIVRNQLILIKWLGSLISKSVEITEFFKEGIDRGQIDEAYKDLYLEIMEDEKVDKEWKFAT